MPEPSTLTPSAHATSRDVVVTDLQMPFGSMVVFMVKWSLASIPALMILFFFFAVFGGIVAGMIGLM